MPTSSLDGKPPGRKLVVGVAIDGSVLSDKALAAACEYCKASRGDRLVILHVSDSSKKGLPRHLQATHLQNTYLAKAAESRVPAEWVCRDKDARASTCETLMSLAEGQKLDLLILGSWGRKGEKIDMLGSVSDYSLRESHSSILVVRATSPPSTEGHTWMFATDGSRAAILALAFLTNQLWKPARDKLVVVAASYDNASATGEDTLKACKDLLAQAKVPADFVVCKLARDQTVADGLLTLAKARDVTDLVLGISGYGKKKLGSVSDDITRHALCNTLVIKDPYEAFPLEHHAAGARTLTEFLQPAAIARKERSSVAGALERLSLDLSKRSLDRQRTSMEREREASIMTRR